MPDTTLAHASPPSREGPLQPNARLVVIGVGASAGGLKAVTQLIAAWDAAADMAFILVQHADPSGGSMLAALLAPHTALTVVEAADGMPIRPGHLYVNPPGRYVSASDGALHLSMPPARHAARMPFDFLLHSLAKQYGDKAGCVVLSGTGTDGTAGLASIKAHGGVVAVQEPAEAGYDGMPVSAVGTGLADFVLPIARIPEALSGSLEPGAARTGAETDGATAGTTAASLSGGPAEGDLADIIALLRTQTPSEFDFYKPGTLRRRIGRRQALAGLGSADLAPYAAMLRAQPEELRALARDLLIHVTSFFRDADVFATLEKTIVPALLDAHPAGRPLRIWVAGCSTGEEAYSLAMLFLERIEATGSAITLQVFASDVDAEAIATAREGAYPAGIADSVTAARLARFFVPEDAGWRVVADLRSTIVFTVQDVLSDPPFSRLDMVSCRNLLIYLRPNAQAKVLEDFHFALCDGGILLLGSAENVVSPVGKFETLAKADRVFRRIARKPGTKPSSSPGTVPRVDLIRPGEERRMPSPAPPSAAARPAFLAELGRRLVIEAYAPASVLVDSSNAVLFSLGPTDRYLRLPPGHATQDLLAMARPGLRAKLRTALHDARESRDKVLDSGWIASRPAGKPFRLEVHPVTQGGETLLLVCFLDAAAATGSLGAVPPRADNPDHAELQRELDATRTELQSMQRDLELSAEDQRAINEEALSVNEEFQSTNEELVASKEELQSLNEELTAVNSQLQETLERQRTTSDDLQNILYSTNVATLFLDLDGRIRFFTPAILALFAIIADDVGRRLTDFAPLVPDPAFLGDMRAAQGGLEPAEREMQSADGTWYRRRILPYRAGGGRVEGVVVTFTNITARKAASHALEAAKLEAEAANAAKSRFLAAASHDLRQPLQTLALLQALLGAAVTTEKAASLVVRQTDALGTITGMLDALLDINEIEAGAVQPHITAFAVDPLLEKLRIAFAPHAEAKNLILRVVPCSLHVLSDQRMLEQMARNLLSNAVKYTATGRILLGCRRHGAKLTLEVCDTGIGMAALDLDTIFEEYRQLDNPARQRSRGLGLGLSIVKRLGALLHHPVRVRSRPGHGSMFAIELPCVARAPRVDLVRPAHIDAEPSATGTAFNILVVEDDPDVAEMLASLLRDLGHSVTLAPDGPAALDRVTDGAPDLVLADYNLPGALNGLELATMIRAASSRSVPVLILTGDISNATVRAVTEAGCMLLNKPAGPASLREAIMRLMMPVAGPAPPTIFVVEDDDAVRGLIVAMLEADGRTAVPYPSAEAFLQAYRTRSRSCDGDCLVVDATLPGISGVELLERLRAEGHGLPVIVVTGHSDVPMAIRTMKAGASDFIEKPVGRTGLLASIVHALDGSRDAATLLARQEAAMAQIAGLTPRQREIMALVLAGHPSKNIAADLGISQRTVENHRASIMHKTGTTSLPALARLALVAGPIHGTT